DNEQVPAEQLLIPRRRTASRNRIEADCLFLAVQHWFSSQARIEEIMTGSSRPIDREASLCRGLAAFGRVGLGADDGGRAQHSLQLGRKRGERDRASKLLFGPFPHFALVIRQWFSACLISAPPCSWPSGS